MPERQAKKIVEPKPKNLAEPEINLREEAEKDYSTQEKASLNRLSTLLRIQMERKSEALRLWVPLPPQEKFHQSKVRTRLIRGGNRSGKTLAACIEVARAVTNQDPYGKYPKKGDWYLVTEQWGEVGRVIYPKLFKKGAFKVIRDQETGLMRAYNPLDPKDRARESKAKESPPLIPKRLIQHIAWHEKKHYQPSRIDLKTGWTMHFFSGDAKPPSGSAIDGALLDEEIPESEWFIELNSRIAEREGVIIWSATPEVGTDQFHDYCAKAQEQSHLLPHEREFEEFKLSVLDNPHFSERGKAGMAGALSDADYQVRILGEFASAGRVIFPEFNLREHGIPYFEIPKSWTYYAAVDPGRQICAVLFGAVPDPMDMVDREDPFDLLLFDELYIPRCTAALFAESMEYKCRERDWESFVIDLHGSRVTEAGSGRSIYDHYKEALEKKGVQNRRHKHNFAFGDDNVKGSIERCRYYLGKRRVHEDVEGEATTPRVRILCDVDPRGLYHSRLPNFVSEIGRWKYKVQKVRHGAQAAPTDEPETRGLNHLMHCFRYLCGLNPTYVIPQTRRRTAIESFLDREQRAFNRQQQGALKPASFSPAGRS